MRTPRPKRVIKIHANIRLDQDTKMHEIALAANLSISELYRIALDEFISRVKMPTMNPVAAIRPPRRMAQR